MDLLSCAFFMGFVAGAIDEQGEVARVGLFSRGQGTGRYTAGSLLLTNRWSN